MDATRRRAEDQHFRGYEQRLVLAFGSVVVVLVLVITATLWISVNSTAESEREALSNSFAHLVRNSAETVGHAGKHHTQLLIEDYVSENPEIVFILIQDEEGKRFAAAGPIESLELETETSFRAARMRAETDFGGARFLSTKLGDLREIDLPFRGAYLNKRLGTIRIGILESQLERGLALALPYVAMAALMALGAALLIVTQLGRRLAAPVRKMADEYADLMESSPVCMALHDADQEILRSSKSFRALLGADGSLESLLDPKRSFNWEDGRTKLLAGREIAFAGEFEVVIADQPRQFVFSRFLLQPGRADQERPIFCVVATDVTAQRELEKSLSQARRIETIGKFAGGVAHDFNNVLTAIQGCAELIKLECREESETHRHAHDIVKSCDRAAHMAKRLLGFGRRQVMVPVPVDLVSIVRESESFLRRLVREDIAMDFETARDALTVLADRGQIEQVLMNLVGNAADALPGRGRIVVRVAPLELEEARVALGNKYLPAGEYAALEISDNGVGIPEEIRELIFDPFESTKGLGKGTGLGLFIVFGIVSRHEGGIELESVLGEGTTFRIILPLTRQRSLPELPPSNLETKAIAGARILVVEDDLHVRSFVSEGLATMGVDVVTARDGRDAIEVFRSTQGSFDLIIMDVVMPRMNGGEAFRELRRLDPEVQVLFMTGYDDHVLAELVAESSHVDYMVKPFALDALQDRIQRRLAADPR